SGETIVALNPPSAKSHHKVSKFGSGIVIVSLPHPDWNGIDTATHGEKEPFAVTGPGAYEIGDVLVTGFGTPSAYDDVVSDVGNTIYIVEMDGMRVLALGALSSPKLPQDVRSDIDDIGIVLVPVGGGTLGPKEAHELVTGIEPKVIIPYAVGKEEDVKAFLKAEGESGIKAADKFTVRAKELAGMDGEVILLE
ncbi:MAG: MBL fold metallo-hydrolase, partial [Patescibacteria group bacterium]|nr:MBL fold metallo-hydrolase [Patescibacteria group bacterium]